MSCHLGENHHHGAPNVPLGRARDVSRLNELSPRQREVLRRIAEGQNTKGIAAGMGITVKTVEAHRLRLMRRLQIDNVAGLVRFAIRTGLVSLED